MKNCLVVTGSSVDPSVPARDIQGNPAVRNAEISELGELWVMRGAGAARDFSLSRTDYRIVHSGRFSKIGRSLRSRVLSRSPGGAMPPVGVAAPMADEEPRIIAEKN
jgi:hypothetical protein